MTLTACVASQIEPLVDRLPQRLKKLHFEISPLLPDGLQVDKCTGIVGGTRIAPLGSAPYEVTMNFEEECDDETPVTGHVKAPLLLRVSTHRNQNLTRAINADPHPLLWRDASLDTWRSDIDLAFQAVVADDQSVLITPGPLPGS